MDHYCNKCSFKAKLIKKSETTYGCPGCHSQFDLSQDQNIKTAQFGGNIAKPNMYGPGSSPLFKGLSNRNKGTNTKFETSFDSIISRTHKPAPIDPERNVEKRLEQFHVHAEEDAIPYELDIKQRARLKVKQNIRRREKFYEDAAKRLDENSVHYIKDNFKPTENQVQTLEESLSSRRKYEDHKEKSIEKDISPEQIKPERRHSVAYTKSKLTTVFDNTETSDEEFAQHDYNPKFLNIGPFEGVYGGTLTNNKQLDQYLDDGTFGLNLFINKTTNAFDYPELDEDFGSNHFEINHPSMVVFDFDPNDDSLEEGLENLMKSKQIEDLPHIKVPQDVNRDKQVNQGKEPRSVFESYPIAPVGTAPLPKSRLK
jgi:hypothetical protein